MTYPSPFSSPDGISDDDWNQAAAQWRAAQGMYDPLVAGPLDQVDLGPGFDPASPAVGAALAQGQMPHAQWQAARAAQLAANDAGTANGAGGSEDGAQASSADAAGAPASARVPSGPQSDFQGVQAAGDFLGHAAGAIDRFAQRLAVGSNGEPATSNNPVVRWAQQHEGGYDYTKVISGAPDARGLADDVKGVVGLRGIGEPKCNQFVYDALSAAGVPPGRLDGGRIPVARDWGDPKAKIGGYAPVSGEPRPGDVVSDGDHVGIYAPLPNGSPGTISAASPVWLHGTGGVLGGVVHNDWGFRPGQRVTIWRGAPSSVVR